MLGNFCHLFYKKPLLALAFSGKYSCDKFPKVPLFLRNWDRLDKSFQPLGHFEGIIKGGGGGVMIKHLLNV